MLFKAVRQIAKEKGIKIKRTMKKADIIREIQKSEGNFPCFGTAKDFCDQTDCIWRDDCLSKGKK